jgi:hypothetical protein
MVLAIHPSYFFRRVLGSVVWVYTKMWIIATFSGFMEFLNSFSVPPGCRDPAQES